MPGPENTLDYAPHARRVISRKAVRFIVLSLLLLALILPMWLWASLYTSLKYRGTRPGMTRAQVERHLWEFTSRPNRTYQGASPSDSVISYELLWFGKGATIQIIYDVNGTVVDAQPIFDN